MNNEHIIQPASTITDNLRRVGIAGLRRNVAALAVALAILASLVLGSRAAGAQSNIYIVQPGDTLTSIALGVYGNASLWPTLYQANSSLIGGDPNLIVPGQRLVVPQAVSAQGVVQAAQTTQYYSVQPGDTLNIVALKVYGNSNLWPVIYEANRALIADPNIIVSGQTLAIPPVSQQLVRQVSQQIVVRQPLLVQQYYTLQPGDTLVRLSERFYGTWVYWPTIYALNRTALGPNPDSPPVGAVIALPVAASLPQVVVRPQIIYVNQPIYVRPRVVVQQQAQPAGPVLILPGAPAQAASGGEVLVRPQPIQGPAQLQLPGQDAALVAFAAASLDARTYSVQEGDTLVKIARAVYGDPSRWPQIYNANLATIGSNPAAVPVGATLNIPE